MPEGFTVIAHKKDPSALVLVRRPPFDICPMCVTKFVVAAYCQATAYHFTLVSVYAPPHKPIEPVLQTLEEVVAMSRSPNIVFAGDLNAKHRAWGPRAGDDRGARVAEFASATGLVFLKDPESEPTYETAYASSWIDAICPRGGLHLAIQIGDTRNEKRKRLTRYAQSELLGALAQEPWFSRVTKSQPASSEALEYILAGFYRVFNHHLKRHLRPVKGRVGGRSWWTPDLALQRKCVNAKRRRFQRCADPTLRSFLKQDYSASLAQFRLRVKEAKRAYEAECHSACSRANISSQSYREAFGKTRPPRLLPPLEREDGTLTSTHLESAALLLRTQIAVDSTATDPLSHTVIRQLASAPYDSSAQDVPFTENEVSDVIAHMPPSSSPGPDFITPLLMKGLFRVQTRFVMFVLNAALRLGYFPHCWRTGRIIFIPKPGRPPQRTTSYRPICVNSVFGKTLERLLNGRIYYILWHNGFIHNN
ncbi:hypothetical protein HPB52_023788 [Rhipicephalus sanguineus]|uniref:Endonuclease/exonuclease/phosphatase domain-containing protein n=1 Tax=Rhipicephalus sanguineus TaxID=34632 RepID=A0A9D4T0K5_RHISA|nr:hypothetical protein HPB52_023788 [Rhipicephalus sanguineus]